jgi:hypothetical protein
MKCKFCGGETADDSKYCELCGKKLRKSKAWLWILLGAGSALITAIILILSLGGSRSNSLSLSDREQVKIAAENFLTAFNNFNWDEAKQYSTPESAEQIDAYASIAAMAGATEPSEFHIEVTSTYIDYDVYPLEATAIYTYTSEGKEPESASLKLKKIDGNWLAVYEKEGFSDEEDVATVEETPDFDYNY